MNIPILDLTAQYKSIKKELDAAVKSVVDSQHFILGPEVEQFEKEVAAYCGTKYAVGTASGSVDFETVARKVIALFPKENISDYLFR